jgi:hypothetical protein
MDDTFFFGTKQDDVIRDQVKVMARGGDDLVSLSGVQAVDDVVPEVIIFGQKGDDAIFGDNGPFYGTGFFSGGSGDDGISVRGGRVLGQTGDDILRTARGFAGDLGGVLRGGDGFDVLESFSTLDPGVAVDRLFGGAGDDFLTIELLRGSGRARMTGGDGADKFGGSGANGRATIRDFDAAAGDRIDVPNEFLGTDAIVQTIGGAADDPFLLVSYEFTEFDRRFHVTYKVLGQDAPLEDAAFV